MHLRALAAEALGSFTIVLAICATAAFQAPAGAGVVAVALAAGLSVAIMSFALGHLSGGHFNPAVTVGLALGKRFAVSDAPAFVLAQVAGGAAAAGLLALVLMVAAPRAGAEADLAAAANIVGRGALSSYWAAALLEATLSALLIVVIMGATVPGAPIASAPLAIGFATVLFYLMAIPVSTGGLNPARSTGAAFLAGLPGFADLWLFWIAPLAGAGAGGLLARWLLRA